MEKQRGNGTEIEWWKEREREGESSGWINSSSSSIAALIANQFGKKLRAAQPKFGVAEFST